MRNRVRPRDFALLVSGAFIGVACGGIAIIDDGGSTSSAGGGATASSSHAATSSSGCDSASHTIDGADYNLFCMQDSDCTPVFLGDLCGPCSCAFSAINGADLAKYKAEAEAKSAGTPPDTCFCPAAKAHCAMGQCVTEVP